MKSKRTVVLVIVVVLIVAAIALLQSRKDSINVRALSKAAEIIVPGLSESEKAERYERAREITQPAGYINSEPFQIADHIGEKVILVDFWTYSCINCQRTLPFITAWDEKYRDSGLLIIGVHTPEFEFEKDRENVLRAVEEFGVEYPVVQDNDFGTWHAYQNRYWPRKYIIDIDGFIVYDHIGEGAYEETEKVIQELLIERAEKLGEEVHFDTSLTDITVDEAITDSVRRSPETYFGAWRNYNFGNGDPGAITHFNLPSPTEVISNIFYLTGEWDVEEEYAANTSKNAVITYKYTGDKVFMVASAPDGAVVRIKNDGEVVTADRGADVSSDGTLRIQDERLYKLIDNTGDVREHTIEIIIEEGSLQAFTFTFG